MANTNPSTYTLPKNGWWTYPNMGNWGIYPDSQGNFPTPDVNIILPAGTPLGAILPGTVTDIRTTEASYGAVVTVRMDMPLNDLATHYALLHMQSIQPGLFVGQHVNIGDILGYGGGNISAGSAPAAVGFALYPEDAYGLGPSWNRYVQTRNNVPDPRLNPMPLLTGAANGTVDLTYLGLNNQNTTGASTASSPNPLPRILPNADVRDALLDLDIYFQIPNPIPAPTDPISWISQFFYTLFVEDATAILLRGIVILAGVFICFRVINATIGVNVPNATRQGFTTGQSAIAHLTE